MPTTLGAPMPPAAVPHVPLRGAPSPARTPGACGGQLGHVPGGPIFRLPLRFIGAAAVGRSSEEAGASSGWLGAPVCGGDTQSRRHRGAGCVRWPARRAGWLAGSPSGSGCGAGGADPVRRGGGRPAAGTALRVSAPHSHVSLAAPWPPAGGRVARRGQEPPGQGRLALPPCPAPAGHPPNLSSLLLSIGVPKSQTEERPRVTADSCHRASALFFFELFDISRCFLVSRCCWVLFGLFSPPFRCSSFLALTRR